MELISNKIEDILAKRKALLPAIEAKLDEWKTLSNSINSLNEALIKLSNQKNASHELCIVCKSFEKQPLQEQILEAMQLFEMLKNRMTRETINIGVSGQARVGKSTLLQTISGLSDTQIPTGSGIPVTAVRSRIYNSFEKPRAIIRFHIFQQKPRDAIKFFYIIRYQRQPG